MGLSRHFFRHLIVFHWCLLATTQADQFRNLSGAGTDTELDQVSFANTQKWSPKFLQYAGQSPKLLPQNWKTRLQIPDPPANSSLRTLAEIRYLHSLLTLREKHLPFIEKERLKNNYQFGKYTFQSLTDNKKFPQAAKLLTITHAELTPIVFHFKKKFNRVRPSILANKLGQPIGHSIPIPSHAAYPSGHATETHTIAYILQEIDPEKAEVYLKNAESISKNREIAGLHYPSDTEAGRLLARQIADLLLANPDFRLLMKKAKTEWK